MSDAVTTTDAATETQAVPTDASTEATTEQTPEFDAEAAQAKIKKVNSEAKALRDRLKAAEEKAAKFDEHENSQKTETQRLADELATLKQAHAESQAANTRLLVAAEFNVPADLIELLGNGTEEEIRNRAQLLAEKLKPVASAPVEDLKPGAQPQNNENPSDPNAWLRQMAGRN